MATPAPAPGIALERLLGAWYLLFSNRAEWRARAHPRLELGAAEPVEGRPTLRATFRYASADLLGRSKPRVASMLALTDPAALGRFEVRGSPLRRAGYPDFCVVALDPRDRWALVWHERSRLGHPPGLDLMSRDPSLTQAKLDAILAVAREHPFLATRTVGLVATTQHWFPVEPYRLP